MKKTHLFSLSTVLLLAVLSSCSVQKRHYTKGYHVSWAHGKAPLAAAPARTQSAPAKPLTAAAVEETAGLPQPTAVAAVDPASACDAPADITTHVPHVSHPTTPVKAPTDKAVTAKKQTRHLAQSPQVLVGENDPAPGRMPLFGADSAFPYTNYGNGNFGSLLIGVFASVVGILLVFLFFFLIDALLFSGGEIILLLILAGMLIALVVVGILFAIHSD